MITIHCNNNKDKLREAKQLPKKKKKYTHTDNKKNEKLDRKKDRYLNRKKASNITSLLKSAIMEHPIFFHSLIWHPFYGQFAVFSFS